MDIYKERRYIAMINKSKTKRMNDWWINEWFTRWKNEWLMNQYMVYKMKEWITHESMNNLLDEIM